MKILQLLFISLAAFSGCTKKANVPVINSNDTTTVKMTQYGTITYLALGDSYTYGQSEPQDLSFPYQLVSTLKANSSFYIPAPTVIATTGWTTEDLIDAIASSNIHTDKYSIVTLLIGVNDQFRGLPQSEYQVNFQQLLNTAINFASGDTSRVFVLSIPDYGVTPFANGQDSVIGPQIDQFNAINKAISIKAGVNYIDITAISREAATDPTLIAPDGLHPSGKMYGDWIQKLEPLVLARLKK